MARIILKTITAKSSNNIESNKADSNKDESNKIESNKIESNKIESNKIESNKIKSNNVESNNVESNKIESNKIESNNSRSNTNEKDKDRHEKDKHRHEKDNKHRHEKDKDRHEKDNKHRHENRDKKIIVHQNISKLNSEDKSTYVEILDQIKKLHLLEDNSISEVELSGIKSKIIELKMKAANLVKRDFKFEKITDDCFSNEIKLPMGKPDAKDPEPSLKVFMACKEEYKKDNGYKAIPDKLSKISISGIKTMSVDVKNKHNIY
jgi:hypothetical protein